VGVQLHTFLTSALDVGEWSVNNVTHENSFDEYAGRYIDRLTHERGSIDINS